MKPAVDPIGGPRAATVLRGTAGTTVAGRIATVFAVILTAACASLQAPQTDYGIREAEALSVRGDHRGASGRYFELAAQRTGEARQRFLILGARETYLANDIDAAGSIIDQLESVLMSANVQLWAEVAAEVRLARGQPERALAALDRIAWVPDQPTRPGQLLLLRAEALFRLGRADEAIPVLIEREAWLATPTELAANQRLIWRGLQTAGPTLQIAPGTLPDDPVVVGWLELGYLAFSRRGEPARLRQDLEAWQQQHPGHPPAAYCSMRCC
jgi:outer membrane PBP1 activator LpoA protein